MLLIDEFTTGELICHRAEMATRWLRGSGIEIGALHRPLILPDSCRVQYVDYKSTADNRNCYPELKDFEIVNTDIIDNGFYLKTISASSQDFIIANHVLEHSPDPYGTLQCWKEKLRPGGVLYITIPISEKCFDRGRQLSSIEHLLADFKMFADGSKEEILGNTKQHLLEFITISGQNIRQENSLLAAPEEEMLELFHYLTSQLEVQMATATSYCDLIDAHIHSINRIYDIHYHTFPHQALRFFCKPLRRKLAAA